MREKIKQLKQVVESYLAIVKLLFCRLDAIDISTNDRQLIFDIKIYIKKSFQKTIVLIDTRVLTLSFVNVNFVKLHKILTITLAKPIKLRLVDDNLISNIIYITQINFLLKNHKKKL